MPLQEVSRWVVYMVRCTDRTLYTGITTDVARRLGEHNGNGKLAARYTRSRRPVQLVYQEFAPSRAQAARREYEIKQMQRHAKEALVSAYRQSNHCS